MHIISKLFDLYYHNYKKLVIIPILLLIFNLSVIFYTWVTTGSPVYLDSSIKGGAILTFNYNESFDINSLEASLKTYLSSPDVKIVVLRSALSNQVIGYEVNVGEEITEDSVRLGVEQFLGNTLNNDNVSFRKQSGTLGGAFLYQSVTLLGLGFIFITIVSFFSFNRNIIPAITISLSTLVDLIGIISVFDLFQIKISTATIGGLLMILGYSTDSDILLANNILKDDSEKLKANMKKTMKTEFMMNLAAITTFTIMILLSTVDIIKHIAMVLLLGIFFDVIDTWLGTGAIQRLFAESRKK